MNESNMWVQHTDSVLFNLEATLSILKDAETGSRGYLLTSEKDFLDPYYAAISKLDENVLAIKKLTSDNPSQQNKVDTLQLLSFKRIYLINESIKLFDQKKFNHAAAFDLLVRGKIIMDQIRNLIDRMKGDEFALWKMRDNRYKALQETFIITFVAGFFISLLTLMLIIFNLNRQIKERSKAEETASESRNLLSVTLSSIGDAVISTDEKGLINFMNKVAENLTEWNMNEAAGLYVEDVFHIVNETTHLRPENPVKRVLTNRKIIGLANHTLLITKSGKEISIDDSCAPIISGENIIGTVLIFRDITFKRNSEIVKERLSEEINGQKLFLNQILSATSDAIFVQDRELKFYYANKSGEILFAKNKEGFSRQIWTEIGLPNEKVESINNITEKVFETGLPSIFNYADESSTEKKYFEFVSNPVLDNNGDVEFVVSSVRDITIRKLNELKIRALNIELENKLDEIKHINEEMESFIYTVSHDLRAPIRHIGGFVDILNKNIYNSLEDNNKRFFNIIKQATIEMGKLIDDLLTFSRLGRSPLNLINVDLNEIVHAIVEDFRIETSGRKLKWEISDLPVVYADPSLLKIVLSNLISNAIKYTSKKEDEAVIIIGHENKDNGMTIFYVKDNGVGFDMKYYDKLFGVFQRLHSQEEFEGTGIGLATVKKIIQKHGGNVWAEGKLNEGAAFYFYLPIYS
jgi:PAS domain S-box-containing protein